MGKAMKVMKVMKGLKPVKMKSSNTKKCNPDVKPKPDDDGAHVMKKPASKGCAASVISQALSANTGLNEKIALLRNSQLTVPEKVKLMNEKLSHPEWNKLNGRFATARAKDSDLDETASQTPKSMLRTLTTAWVLDPSKGEVFRGISCNISASHTMTKTLVWESEKSILTKWSQDELDKHLNSGRIIWREDPSTPGVFEYKDTKNMSEVKQLHRQKQKELAQKSEVIEDAFEDEMLEMEGHWNSSGVESYHLLSLRGNDAEGKGSSGSKGNPKGKGKGKVPNDDDPKKKLKSLKALLTSTTKSLAVWGFNQANMQPKVKKTLQQNIKKLEKQSEMIISIQDGSMDDINKFAEVTMKLIGQCKEIMD